MKYVLHGNHSPLLLTPVQNFAIFAVLFVANLALLIALVRGAGQNKVALESMARTVEREQTSAAEQTRKAEPPAPRAPAPPEAIPDARSSNLRISMPQGWKWRGCQVSASGDSVEILLGR